MRFMVMVKANEQTEAGVMPSEELLAAMGKYNEELAKAGVRPSRRQIARRKSPFLTGSQHSLVD